MGLEYNSRRAKDPIHFQVYNYNYFLESYRVWKNLDSSLHSKCFSWSHLVNNESERERESQRQKVHTQPGHTDQEEVIKCSIYIFIQARVHSEKFSAQVLLKIVKFCACIFFSSSAPTKWTYASAWGSLKALLWVCV